MLVMMWSLGFLSVSYIPVLELNSWQARNTNRHRPKKKNTQSLLSLAKGPGKGQFIKRQKTLDSKHSIPAKHRRKKCVPNHTLTSKSTAETLEVHLHRAVTRLPLPYLGDVTGSSVGSQGFHHHRDKEATPVGLVQVRNSNGAVLFLPAREGSVRP